MRLIEPSEEYARQISAYRKEFLDSGDSMDGTGALRRMEDAAEWIRYSKQLKDPATVTQNWVPSTQYMLVREEDNKIVGMIQLRHCFNQYLEEFGGHIGYSVAPSERRKGYCALMLKMLLEKCREMGMDKVLLTCIKGNEGSKRTILINGGVFETTVFEPHGEVWLERYWIHLN